MYIIVVKRITYSYSWIYVIDTCYLPVFGNFTKKKKDKTEGERISVQLQLCHIMIIISQSVN